MANRRMRYAYSVSDDVIHDRDCSKVSEIRDADFRMSEEFLLEKQHCKECYRRAVIRAGVQPDDAKHIYDYVRELTRLRAQTVDLGDLFINRKAVLQSVEQNAVCIKVRDDKWLIRGDGDMLQLLHNNYTRLSDYSRIIGRNFHPHEKDKSFYRCIPLMCSYSWKSHVERFKRDDLSVKLEGISNYVRANRFSLLYSYFYIMDRKQKIERLGKKGNAGLKVINREWIDDTYSVVLCRVPRWKQKVIQEIARQMKACCVTAYWPEYADYCIKYIGQE